MSGLEIPDRAYEVAEAAHEEAGYRTASARLRSDSAVEAAAPIILAAYLRQLADENDPVARVARVWLQNHADKLDPEGATR